mmetsp:Transcript_7468/g.20382  ORF Transcript_7468/g.20382 Transcript_7468/m.20382 type:complete len:356 (-) Transcript_7468:1799-2866(-)
MGDMGACKDRRLPVDEVAVDERVFEQRGHSVHVVLPHLCDVLEQEAGGLEHAILHVHIWRAVLVHQRGDDGEGRAALRDDGNGHRRADPVLSVLDLEIVEKGHKHVLWSDRLRDVPKCGNRCASNRLAGRAKHIQELEADAHPLFGVDLVGRAVRDRADELDGLLLHLVVPVSQNRGHSRHKVPDGRRHVLERAHREHDGVECTEDGSKDVGVLLSEILEQDDPQVSQQLFLVTPSQGPGDFCDEVRSALPDLCRLVVQPPLDCPDNLSKVWARALAQGVDHRAESVQYDRSLVRILFLVRVEEPIHQQLLEPGVDVGRAERGNHPVNRLRDHLPVRLALVFQIIYDPPDNFRAP